MFVRLRFARLRCVSLVECRVITFIGNYYLEVFYGEPCLAMFSLFLKLINPDQLVRELGSRDIVLPSSESLGWPFEYSCKCAKTFYFVVLE